ncbi:GNAT family N-acetyltransferase [Bacillus taeanensis]|uniref:GNAT family N-acetyltransferase n=1 Tax=Bacillus taeanensis TaxID=273032 RepID=A0A366XSV6_9BACI|nr:GNAT family N-acetyltransferase [Bacillus taeanensis]RBW69222.1 GNAT family N-acetyltransferase [Bacillus taeanensis]
MIRKLTDLDTDDVLYFLKKEAAMNLFMIGDIEAFRFETKFHELWGDFDEEHNIRAILLRFYHIYTPYAQGKYDAKAFSEIINRDECFEGLTGKKGVTEQIEPFLTVNLPKKRTMNFLELKSEKKLDHSLDVSIVKKAEITDIDRLLLLRSQMENFTEQPTTRENMKKVFESKTGRTVYIEKEEELVASASTIAENSMSAMIVGVCTLPAFRKKGLATLCVTALCKEVLSEGKTVCLFYDNPNAGKIYKRLGFEEIGMWNYYKP